MPRVVRLTALAVLASTAQATPLPDGFMEVEGAAPGGHLVVTAGRNVQRVGNGVLTRTHAVNANGSAVSLQILLACDGSWISEVLQAGVSNQPTFDPVKMEAAAISQEDHPPLDVVHIMSTAESELLTAVTLGKNARKICKGAFSEHRGVTIPVAGYVTDGKAPGGIISIVVGTAKRNGGSIDLWLRTTSFTSKDILAPDGSPIIDERGVHLTQKTPTGASSLTHQAMDCAKRATSTIQSIEYNTAGGVIADSGVSKQPFIFHDVIPDSVGEAELVAVCRIYGAAN